MIAKLIAHASTRTQALDLLAAALRETEVDGVTTNLPFLRGLVDQPVVRAGAATTAFLTEHPPLSRTRAAPRSWGAPWRLNLPPPPPAAPPDLASAADHGPTQEKSTVTAPMPGTVIKVLVATGDRVAARQPLVVLEAMKMETPLLSPYDASVRAVHVTEGERVAGGTLLVELEE
jgi:acetyl/propionyl-CoA carboxylase alpha subunit